MTRTRVIVSSVCGMTSLALLAASACQGASSSTFSDDKSGSDSGGTGGASAGQTTAGETTSGSSSDFDTDGGCVRLECRQVTCENGAKTTLSGTVYDPAGKVPLYNVLVYVPNGPLEPLAQGASCDKCAASATGLPLVSALTDAQGHFVLENVPVGDDVPLVMQVGKWRRVVKLPTVESCKETAIDNKDLLRLPRSQSEGDLPRIALTTGAADPLECLLRKVGVADSEFTPAGGSGRIHLYKGAGYSATLNDGGVKEYVASSKFADAVNGGAAFADAATLWSSVEKLKEYDVVLFACEGDPVGTKPGPALQALHDYVGQGGRAFASHYHDYWFENGPGQFPSVAQWAPPLPPPSNPSYATLNTSFPKGQAFKTWLGNVDGLTDAGLLELKESRHSVLAAGASSQSWLSLTNTTPGADAATSVQYLTFNAPLDVPAENQCGRVVFSDLHVSSGDKVGVAFPDGCITQNLSPQEKALEFMLFDLSACIQKDTDQPSPPK